MGGQTPEQEQPNWEKDLELRYDFFFDNGTWNYFFRIYNQHPSTAYQNVQIELSWFNRQIVETKNLTDIIQPGSELKFKEIKQGPSPFERPVENAFKIVAAEAIRGVPAEETTATKDDQGGADFPPADTQPQDLGEDVLVLTESEIPKIIKKVEPEYPEVARVARISGDVSIEVVVDQTGAVTKTKIVQGPPLLQEAALDAVKQWTFEPYKMKDETKTVRFTVTVSFCLRK